MKLLFLLPGGTAGVEIVGWTLVHFLWQGAGLGLLAGLVLARLARQSPQLRYAVACAGLVLMAICPIITAIALMHRPATTSLAVAMERPANGAAAGNSMGDLAGLPARNGSVGNRNAGPAMSRGSAAASASSLAPFLHQLSHSLSRQIEPWLPALTGAWCMGVWALSVRLAVGYRQMRGWQARSSDVRDPNLLSLFGTLSRRLGTRPGPRLLESAGTAVPAVVGYFRPVVIVPVAFLSNLTVAEAESLLAHELAHVRRHDWIVNLLQSLLEILLFFHPAVWWLSGVVRREREHCCDDVAIAATGNRLALVRALARLEEARCAAALAVSANGGVLVNRIRRLVTGVPANSGEWPTGALAVIVLTGLSGAMSFAVYSTGLAVGPAHRGSPPDSAPVRAAEDATDSGSDPAAEDPVLQVFAQRDYPPASRTSTAWLDVDGVQIPVDEGIEHDGVRLHLSLMFDVIAVDAASGKTLWSRRWSKSDPVWTRLSIVELARPTGSVLAVEAAASAPDRALSDRLFLDLRTGAPIPPQVRAPADMPPVDDPASPIQENPSPRGQQMLQMPGRAEADSEWGAIDPETGLQTRLTLLSPHPRMGQPLQLRLEIRNAGREPAGVDPQVWFPFRVVRVEDAAGRSAPFIGMTPQTESGTWFLAPGDSWTPWTDIDLTDLFLLDSPGPWTVFVKSESDPAEPGFPASNRLTIQLEPQPLPPVDTLISTLIPRLPPEWRLMKAFGRISLIDSPNGLKADVAIIDIELLPPDSAEAVPAGNELVGRFACGTLVAQIPDPARQLWPDCLAVLRAAADAALADHGDPGPPR